MIANQTRTVRFMERQDAVDLYRCSENGRVYARMKGASQNTVRWLTTSAYCRGYEPDTPMKAGLRMDIVDGYSHNLFTEEIVSGPDCSGTYAEKQAPFSWETEKELAAKWRETFSLLSHEEWRKKLTEAKCHYAPAMDLDNWCYYETSTLRMTRVPEQDALGRRLYVECYKVEHRISHQRWTTYTLTADPLTPLEICGYEWVDSKEGEER